MMKANIVPADLIVCKPVIAEPCSVESLPSTESMTLTLDVVPLTCTITGTSPRGMLNSRHVMAVMVAWPMKVHGVGPAKALVNMGPHCVAS